MSGWQRRNPQESLPVRLTRLAVPVMVANLTQTMMALVDTLMVGRLGEAPIAAVGVATLYFSVLAGSLKAIDVAVQTFAAQRVGAGRRAEVGTVLATSVTVAVVSGALFTGLGMWRPEALMGLVTNDPQVRALGADYLRWRYPGLLPWLVFCMFRATFDGIGATRIGMVAVIVMNVANLVLNWILIFGRLGAPRMGVGGAALASTLASLLAAIVVIAWALRRPVRRAFGLVRRSNLDVRLMLPFLRLAWPPALQSFGLIAALLVFFGILGRISTLAVAAGNVALRIASLSIMSGVGVAVATQTVVGQAVGRGDLRAAARSGWTGVAVAMIFMGAFGLLFLLAPGTLLRLFSSSEALAHEGRPILRLLGLVQLFAALGLALGGALRGAGATHAVMVIDIACGWCLFLPMTWLFGVVLHGGLLGAWWGVLLWICIYALGMMAWWLKGSWKEIRL